MLFASPLTNGCPKPLIQGPQPPLLQFVVRARHTVQIHLLVRGGIQHREHRRIVGSAPIHAHHVGMARYHAVLRCGRARLADAPEHGAAIV